MTDYPVINGLIFCGLGIIVFIIAFSLVLKLAPLDLWKQIGEERNIAAGHPGGSGGAGNLLDHCRHHALKVVFAEGYGFRDGEAPSGHFR